MQIEYSFHGTLYRYIVYDMYTFQYLFALCLLTVYDMYMFQYLLALCLLVSTVCLVLPYMFMFSLLQAEEFTPWDQ